MRITSTATVDLKEFEEEVRKNILGWTKVAYLDENGVRAIFLEDTMLVIHIEGSLHPETVEDDIQHYITNHFQSDL